MSEYVVKGSGLTEKGIVCSTCNGSGVVMKVIKYQPGGSLAYYTKEVYVPCSVCNGTGYIAIPLEKSKRVPITSAIGQTYYPSDWKRYRIGRYKPLNIMWRRYG